MKKNSNMLKEEQLAIPACSPKLKPFVDFMKRHLIGQPLAIERVTDRLESYYAKLTSSRRRHPMFAFAFLGPTGVGKTEFGRLIAQYFFNSRDAVYRIDCSEYMERHAADQLIGSPVGYVGHDEEPVLSQRKIERGAVKSVLMGSKRSAFEVVLREELVELKNHGFKLEENTGEILFNGFISPMRMTSLGPVQENPIEHTLTLEDVINIAIDSAYYDDIGKPYGGLLMLDEIDKAHSNLLNMLLQILEEGEITMRTQGNWPQKTDFTHCGIIMTSNHGSATIQKIVSGGDDLGFRLPGIKEKDFDVMDRKIYLAGKKAAKDALRPELRSRLGKDAIVIFRPLARKHFERILELQMSYLHDDLIKARFPLVVELSSDAVSFILEESVSSEYGARRLERVLEKDVRRKIEIGKNSGVIHAGEALRFDINDQGDDLVVIRSGGVVVLGEEDFPPLPKHPFYDFVIEVWELLTRPSPKRFSGFDAEHPDDPDDFDTVSFSDIGGKSIVIINPALDDVGEEEEKDNEGIDVEEEPSEDDDNNE